MPPSQTYSINEAAALTGLHRNTIRQRVRLGQLEASVHAGKFGDEYRIEHASLVHAGLLAEMGPLGEIVDGPPRDAFDAPRATPTRAVGTPTPRSEAPGEATEANDGGSSTSALASSTLAALSELYQRHEQAMFRLGFMQSELDRVKALAETAESLRKDSTEHEQEIHALRTALQSKEREAAEAEKLRAELARARDRLTEMESLRGDIEQLKQMAASKRPWWRFWEG